MRARLAPGIAIAVSLALSTSGQYAADRTSIGSASAPGGVSAIAKRRPLPEFPRVREFSFEAMDGAASLAAAKVYAIEQDAAGFLWFGSSNGLYRYDGLRYKAYRADPDDPRALPRDFVTCLEIDARGGLWVGTDGGGACRYDQRTDGFERWSASSDNPARRIAGDSVWGMLSDSRGDLWISTRTGLSRLSPGTLEVRDFRANSRAADRGPCGDDLWPLAEDSSGAIWIGSDGAGLSRYDPAADRFEHWTGGSNDPSGLGSSAIFSLYVDSGGALWVGTAGGGLCAFDRGARSFRCLRFDAGDPGSLSDDTVRAIAEDGQGKLWVGTTDGLNLLDRETGRFRRFGTDGPSDRRIHAIFRDSSGVTWFGTRAGVDKLVRPRFEKLAPSDDPRRNDVRALLIEETGSAWIGSYAGLDYYAPDAARRAIFDGAVCYSLLASASGRIVAGTDVGIYFVEMTPGGSASIEEVALGTPVIALFERPAGTLWFGTEGRGFGRFDPSGLVTWFQPVRPDGTPIPDASVGGFAWDGSLIVATMGAGLNRFDPADLRVSPLTTLPDRYITALVGADSPRRKDDPAGPRLYVGTESLGPVAIVEGSFERICDTPNRVAVRSIVEDGSGVAWIATDEGVARFDPRAVEGRTALFRAERAALGANFNPGAAFIDARGYAWFGCVDGILLVDTRADLASPASSGGGILALEAFGALDGDVDLSGGGPSIELGDGRTFLRFRASVFDFRYPEGNSVEWSGSDGVWRAIGPGGEVVFPDLSPGLHSFSFRATDADGARLPNVRTVHVEVPYPWYARWYAFLGYAALLVALVVAYVRLKTASQRREIRRQEAVVAERTRELTAAKAALERAMADKTSFFENLAHETRTPLTFVKNYLERAMRKRPGDEDLDVVHRNVGKLVRDMVNFLDAEKISRGSMDYDHSLACDVGELLETKLPMLRESCDRRSIALSARLPEGIMAQGDPYAIDRIANNLIDNAIKYGRQGGSIGIALSREGDTVSLEVIDDGPGIPVGRRDSIFERYHQLSRPKERAQGIGMGLYLVKAILESMGGSIEVGDPPGGGTSMIARMPAARADGSVRPAMPRDAAVGTQLESFGALEGPQPADGEQRADRRTILAVDDDPGMLAILADSFSTDYNLRFAKDGAEALAKLGVGQEPDVVICDVMMDGMDGYGFLAALRASPFAHVPLIFLTAKSGRGDALRGLGGGAVDYIRKPFSTEELTAKVGSLLDSMELGYRAREAEMRERLLASLGEKARPEGQGGKKERFARFVREYRISPREAEVIELLAKGLLNKEIADALGLSVRTVEKHVFNAYRKANAQNKIELVNKIESG